MQLSLSPKSKLSLLWLGTFWLLALLFTPRLMATSSVSPNADSSSVSGADTPVLYYVWDPLCGWCYGFAPVMDSVEQHYAGRLKVELVLGGLAIGERAAPVSEAYGYIKGALQTVENRTGVAFGQGFRDLLEEGSYVYNSLPPCKAIVRVRQTHPETVLEYAHLVQSRFFREGANLNDPATYRAINRSLNLPEDLTDPVFNNPAWDEKLAEEFNRARELGATGFPTLVLQNGKSRVTLARGYTDFRSLQTYLDNILGNH